MKKTITIARATAKEAMRQPVFFVLLFVAIAMLLIFPLVPYNTFGEDVKMVKDTGLQAILISSLLMALLTASSGNADEIEGRTAITLLSKPVNRRQFIVGKFVGILLVVLTMFLVLGALFCLVIIYKVGYDARESARVPPPYLARLPEVYQILPGLVLAYFEVIVIGSVSVAISTRLPMLVNLGVCLALFVLGHLTPILVQVSEGQFEAVGFMAKLFATIFPQLEVFNVHNSIATGLMIPADYLFMGFLYCVLYCVLALLGAFILFEDRDLA